MTNSAAVTVAILLLLGRGSLAGIPNDVPLQTAGPTTAPGPSIDLPPEIRTALQHSATNLTPITVKWETKSSSPLKPQDAARAMKLDVLMARMFIDGVHQQEATLQDGKVLEERLDNTPQDNGKTSPSEFDVACDGQTIVGAGRGNAPTMFIEKIAKRDPKSRWVDADYYDTAGFDPGLLGGELANRRGVKSEILARLEKGAHVVAVTNLEIAGRKIVRLTLVQDNETRAFARSVDMKKVEEELHHSAETPDGIANILDSVRQRRELPELEKYTYDLDPTMNYAVRRREHGYLNGVITGRIECDDFVNIANRNVWLPRILRSERFTSDRRPDAFFKDAIIVTTHSVLSISSDRLPDNRFSQLRETPGMRIYDRSGEKEKIYQVDSDGARQEIDRQHPFKQPDDVGL